MRTRLEAAVAQEILDTVKDQGRTLKWVQERSGVKARAWGYYFKGDRPIPFQVLADVCAVLGVRTSDVIAKAEATLEQAPAATLSEHITRQLGPEAQEAIAEGVRQVKGKSRKRQDGH